MYFMNTNASALELIKTNARGVWFVERFKNAILWKLMMKEILVGIVKIKKCKGLIKMYIEIDIK